MATLRAAGRAGEQRRHRAALPRLHEASEELFDKTIAVNLKGPFRLSALAASHMAEAGGGSIINISSVAAMRPTAYEVPYGAAKAGLHVVTAGIALEYGPAVRANTIMAGPFLTDISAAWDMAAFDEFAAAMPMRRAGRAGRDHRRRAVLRQRPILFHHRRVAARRRRPGPGAAMSRFGEADAVRPGEDLDWDRLRAYLADHLGPAERDARAAVPERLGQPDLPDPSRRPAPRLPPPAVRGGRARRARHGREYRVLSRLWQAYRPRSARAALLRRPERRRARTSWCRSTAPGRWSGPSCRRPGRRSRTPGGSLGLATSTRSPTCPSSTRRRAASAELGRPDGFLRRQVEGWTARWLRVATGDADGPMTAVAELLARRLPEPQRVSVLHNDFKIDNCQFAFDDPSRVSAVFDWDMATLGDPLVDLGILLNYWPDPADRPDDHALSYPGLENSACRPEPRSRSGTRRAPVCDRGDRLVRGVRELEDRDRPRATARPLSAGRNQRPADGAACTRTSSCWRAVPCASSRRSD